MGILQRFIYELDNDRAARFDQRVEGFIQRMLESALGRCAVPHHECARTTYLGPNPPRV